MRSHQLSLVLLLSISLLAVSCGDPDRFKTANTSDNTRVPEVEIMEERDLPGKVDLDVPFVPTPMSVVDKMLEMAEVKGDDVLYDLGSGDGRIPVIAAKRLGTRGVGIDIDPRRIEEANQRAKDEGVTDKVKFIQGDIFKEDFSEATVVTLYLLPDVNLRLKPRLLEMKPGTRIVSHNYDMGDWKPEKQETVTSDTGSTHYVYFWRVPEKQ
jgi:hypothetical protein